MRRLVFLLPFLAAPVLALGTWVSPARSQAPGSLTADEQFLVKHPWIFRGGGSFTRYGATDKPGQLGFCIDRILQFHPNHTVAMRCSDGKDRTGIWRLDVTAQTTLVIRRADLPSELRFTTYFHGNDPERLNLQEPSSERLAPKTVLSYGPD